MSSRFSNTWSNVRVRYIVAALLMPLIYLPGASSIYSILGTDAPPYAYDLSFYFYVQFIWFVAAYLTATFPVEIPTRKLVGDLPSRRHVRGGLTFSLWLLIVAIAAGYWLFLPLSYWIPNFVTFWFINVPDVIYYYDGAYPLLPNAMSLIVLCVTAPLLEEFVFRGLILHRWAHKYGVKSAIVGSSLLFGLLHPDPLGAFLFGVGMSVLYLRSRSLILPILCHSAYNFTVWLLEVVNHIYAGPNDEYTLETFQNDWAYGAVATIVATVWAIHWIRNSTTSVSLQLPAR